MTTAKFIYDTAERCPDLYYATKFSAPDPFIYFEVGGKKHLVMSDLEIGRAKKTAKVNKIHSLSKFSEKAKKLYKNPTTIDTLDTIFKEFHIKKLEVPQSMPCVLADALRKKHYKVVAGEVPFYPKRLQKTPDEKKMVARSQKVVFEMMAFVENMFRSCKIKDGFLYYKGKKLTSEDVKTAINVELMKRNFIASDGTIVACGNDAVDPHCSGHGPLRAHQAIVVDIFPKSQDTLFWGDSTRTFCVGKAPEKLKKLYNTVKAGQEYALKNIKAGVNGKDIHEGIHKLFAKLGYTTGEKDGRMQGFFHSTGHGIGLELHESPTRIGPLDQKLKEGTVVTVEPGLYYHNLGGVRIEDIVYVTKNGCEILSHYPKKFEII